MSTNDDRDTHFANFARLLLKECWPELLMLFSNEPAGEVDDIVKKQVEQIIARRAYDFSEHVIARTIGQRPSGVSSKIRDMTAFPEQSN